MKLIDSTELRIWGATVGRSFDRVTVVHDYFCGLCNSSLQTVESPLVFINLHNLVSEVMLHLKTEHPEALPPRPEAK